ncbi:MAG: chemotaxis protein CheB [Oleibacter sp.]|nr:chemotaxis protein CheB [Thalassolituus sp.]
MTAPRFALITDDSKQSETLGQALAEIGYSGLDTWLTSKNTLPTTSDYLQVTLWLVSVSDDDSALPFIDQLINDEQPFLMGMGFAPRKHDPKYPAWRARFELKLNACLADIDIQSESQAQPKPDFISKVSPEKSTASSNLPFIWVLGASLGGPNAVREFIQTLPPNLPIAFIYAQHIAPEFENSLAKTVGRNSAYNFKCFSNGMQISAGDVLVVPIKEIFGLGEQDTIWGTGERWQLPHQPCIDQVIQRVHRHAQQRFGCIIFSGMGDDGSQAIKALPSDVPVWTQQADSCDCDSMPISANATEKVSFMGSPVQLAINLVETIIQKQKESRYAS